MNDTEINEFSVPMWAEYETIQLDKLHFKSYTLRTLRQNF